MRRLGHVVLLASVAPAALPPPPVTPERPASPTERESLDLSTPDRACATIYAELKRGDKAGFRKCIIRERVRRLDDANAFDESFAIWKAGADRHASFPNIAVAQEDGVWKLDEN